MRLRALDSRIGLDLKLFITSILSFRLLPKTHKAEKRYSVPKGVRIALAVFNVLLASAPISLSVEQETQPAALNWSDSLRDVYIDGQLDRTAQVLVCNAPRRLALLSRKIEVAIVLDLKERAVATMSKEAFRFAPDHTSAVSDASIVIQRIGTFTTVMNSTYYAAANGRSILISRHTGITGEISLDRLLESMPVWQSLMESYSPNGEAIRVLKACNIPTELFIAIGTWCPDSRRYVPQLLKVLREAGNDNITAKIIGIDIQFHEPLEVIQKRGLINVPTVIVERNGREIGRIVETPAAKTIEEDLAAILIGSPNIHPGRWERGPLTARGTYTYLDRNSSESGSEKWELYRVTSGGNIVHSLINKGDVAIDVWYQTDANKQATFIEVTKRQGNNVSRTRYYRDGQRLNIQMRGNEAGAIEQTIVLPEHVSLSSPSLAAQDWTIDSLSKSHGTLPVYSISDRYQATLELIKLAKFKINSEETIRVPAGRYLTRRLTRTVGKEVSHWWLHSDLGIPVKGRLSNGIEYRLATLEVIPVH